jgi:hypothetical protein
MAPALGGYAGAIISSDAGGAPGTRNMRAQILNSVCSIPDSKPKKNRRLAFTDLLVAATQFSERLTCRGA